MGGRNKKLDNVLTSQKNFSDKTKLGYTNEGSSSVEPKNEMKFMLAKVVEKPKVEGPVDEKKAVVVKSKAKGKSLPKNQRGPQVKHFYHHCSIRGHTRTNCFKLHTFKRTDQQNALGNEKGRPKEKLAKGEDHGLCRYLILYSVNKFWSPAPMMSLTYINQKKFTIV